MTFFKAYNQLQKKLARCLRTDIPLEKNTQTRFLSLLVGLMSFLFTISLAGTITLNDLSHRWSSQLQNKITIEISAENRDGFALNTKDIKKETYKLIKEIRDDPNIQTLKALKSDEIRELVSPWIDKNLELSGVPLPGLIAIELKNNSQENLDSLNKKIQGISKHAYLQTHEEWLDDFLAIMSTLKTLSLFIALIVIGITLIAITSAMMSRLELYKKDVQLLHLMGASDQYIAKQFIPHNLIITLKGSATGVLCAVIFVIYIINQTSSPIIPELHLSLWWVAALLLSPVFFSLISATTSYLALLRTMAKMP